MANRTKTNVIRLNPNNYSKEGWQEINSRMDATRIYAGFIREKKYAKRAIIFFTSAVVAGVLSNFLFYFLTNNFVSNSFFWLLAFLIMGFILAVIVYGIKLYRDDNYEEEGHWKLYNNIRRELRDKYGIGVDAHIEIDE